LRVDTVAPACRPGRRKSLICRVPPTFSSKGLSGRNHALPAGKQVWIRLGSAWAHADGIGFNLQLETIPLDGRIALRIAAEKNKKFTWAGFTARLFFRLRPAREHFGFPTRRVHNQIQREQRHKQIAPACRPGI
jgi:hypothetical protein